MELKIDIEKKIGNFHLKAKFTSSSSRIGFFGHSGCGKTTLSSIIAGINKPDKGIISIRDKVLFSSENKINIPTNRRNIAIVFQGAHLFPHLTVRENLKYGLKRRKNRNKNINFDRLTETLNLNHLLTRKIHNLSGGEKQRIAIGRALLSSPELIILDEPLTGLDHHLKSRIMQYLDDIFNTFKVPYIYISHSIKEMRIMTDESITFLNGITTDIIDTEKMAKELFKTSKGKYTNLIELTAPKKNGDLCEYTWHDNLITTTECSNYAKSFFELPSSGIIIFKEAPVASSARNILKGKIKDIFDVSNRVCLVLDINGGELIAQVVHSALEEMKLKKGDIVSAVIKASSLSLV